MKGKKVKILRGMVVLAVVIGFAMSPSMVKASQIVNFFDETYQQEALIEVDWYELTPGGAWRYEYTLTNTGPNWFISQIVVRDGIMGDPDILYAPIDMGGDGFSFSRADNNYAVTWGSFLLPNQTGDTFFFDYEVELLSQEISISGFNPYNPGPFVNEKLAEYPLPRCQFGENRSDPARKRRPGIEPAK